MNEPYKLTRAFADADGAIRSKLRDGESVVWRDEEAYLFDGSGLGVRIGSLSWGASYLASRVAERRKWLADPGRYLMTD